MVIDINTKQEKKKVTVCTKCKHFHNKEPQSVRKDVWYNHICKATKFPTKVSPYNGEEQPYNTNDLGNEYFTDTPHEYCRDVKKGDCNLYKENNHELNR